MQKKARASIVLVIVALVGGSLVGMVAANAYSHGGLLNGFLNSGRTVPPGSLPANASSTQPLDRSVVYQKPSYCGMLFTIQISNNSAGVTANMAYPNGDVYSFSKTTNNGVVTLTYELAQSLPAGSYTLSVTVQQQAPSNVYPYTLSSTFENCQSQTPPPPATTMP